jgi:hypothetical protein
MLIKNGKLLKNKIMFETPTQEIFDEMKIIATEIWNTYSDEHGYRTEKLNYINSFENIEDNAMIFFRMFDWNNQQIFISKSTNDIVEYIKNNM